MQTLLMVLFLVTGVLLILLVLIQRGRGGGLAGAFGGPGGHSAFGTQTADVFMKATAVLGALFVILAIVTAFVMRRSGGQVLLDAPPPAEAPAEPGAAPPTNQAAPTPVETPPAAETPTPAEPDETGDANE